MAISQPERESINQFDFQHRTMAIALLDRNRARPRWPSSCLLGGPSASLSVNTCAPAEARIREMARRLQETLNIGFPLLVGQIAKLGSINMTFPAHRPELLPLDVPSRDVLLERANHEFSQVANPYLDMALAHAGHDAERWAYFLKKARVIHTPVESRSLERLEEVRPRAWKSLGGGMASGPGAVSWGDGRIDVFARGPADALMHRWYKGAWRP
ncbi:hypothetical protein [Sorangium sp. So ce204]|uniref:hypothetical protein n=1 Tax=Sorangium sp. So ce204 TaxID=3133288 RepID=UPI003F6021D2